MKSYELNCIISPDFSEEEIKNFQERVRTLIQEEGGFLISVETYFKKKLGFLIKNRISGNLVNFNFQADPGKLEGLKIKLKAEPQTIRLMITVKKSPRLMKAPRRPVQKTFTPEKDTDEKQKEEKVELKEIEKKLEEILGE